MTTFTLSQAHVDRLFARAQIERQVGNTTLFGLRGAAPANVWGGGPAKTFELSTSPLDYRHARCAIGMIAGDQRISLYPGSTVPYGPYVEARIGGNGVGVNQLCIGLHRGYAKGVHKQSNPATAHRALRIDRAIAIQRTGDDADFDGLDRLELETAFDNIHSSWVQSPDVARYESLGCQVIIGLPRPVETGPWKEFVTAIYALEQQQFDYALFKGSETQFVANTPADTELPIVLRYGSRDADGADDLGAVFKTQASLQTKGYLASPPDGHFGYNTTRAVFAFQRRIMGPDEADGLVGPQTASMLELDNWPTA